MPREIKLDEQYTLHVDELGNVTGTVQRRFKTLPITPHDDFWPVLKLLLKKIDTLENPPDAS